MKKSNWFKTKKHLNERGSKPVMAVSTEAMPTIEKGKLPFKGESINLVLTFKSLTIIEDMGLLPVFTTVGVNEITVGQLMAICFAGIKSTQEYSAITYEEVVAELINVPFVVLAEALSSANANLQVSYLGPDEQVE